MVTRRAFGRRRRGGPAPQSASAATATATVIVTAVRGSRSTGRSLAVAAALALAGCAARNVADGANAGAPPGATPIRTTPAVPSPSAAGDAGTAAAPRRAALLRLEAGRPARLAVDGVRAADGDDDARTSRIARSLDEALQRDLRAIGTLDPGARTRLAAVLMRQGAVIEALVTVTRDGHTRLRKRYRLDAVAPAADAADAVRSLLGDVYDDPEFDLAVKE